MRSRTHAIGTSMAAALLPFLGWLSTVIVALVVLRQGALAGSLVLLWTLLPLGAVLYLVGDPSPTLALVGTFVIAVMLRQTMSWELVLGATVLLSATAAFVFELTASDVLVRFVEFYLDYLQRVGQGGVLEQSEAASVLLGFFALGQAYAMLIMLIVARWCQSALYNPNGLSKEFHQLRLSPAFSVVMVSAMLLCFAFSEQLGRWLPLLTVPLIFAALGLVHWLFAYKKLSGNWVAGFYTGLILLFQFVYPFLASLALMDSLFNIRNKIQPNQED